MATKTRKRKSTGSKQRFIGKPNGQIQERVQAVGPDHFGIVSVDCAKRRSKWMLCNFYGKVLIEPATVEHTAGGLWAMTQQVTETCRSQSLADTIVAIEMTGVYHKPVQRAFRKAGFDTRIVHPFASKHYRRPLHPDEKTDDHDLEAIFHAAVNGYGLATLPVGDVYQSLQAASRHRHNLVKQRSRLMVQMRRLLHQTMPGFGDLFDDDHLFHRSIALPIARQFSSPAAIRRAGGTGIATHLVQAKVRFQMRTIERIVAWAGAAAEPAELAEMYTRQWQQLDDVRRLFEPQIEAAEREMAGFLVKTPYVLLLSVTGINVISAGRLAGEAGPIEHYATARAINGRAGLYPSRYQSDELDRADGSLVRQCNRQLRGAAMLVAENLIKCHPYYRGLSALWRQQHVDPRDRRCRVANRAMRMVYQLVGGRQVWRGRGVDREYLLLKLQEFHRVHHTPITQTIRDLNEAFTWLPKSEHAAEAKPLAELVHQKRRGPQRIGDLLIPLLIRLGLSREELGVAAEEAVESTTSEARGSG
jgi:transposase